MSQNEVFFAAMSVIFGAPFIIWRLLRIDYWAPLVVVQIVFGVLFGPGIAGSIFPQYFVMLLNHETISALNGIALWGVAAFIFSAGIEMDVREAWLHRTETLTTASFALLVPLVFGGSVAFFLMTYDHHWIGPNGDPWQFTMGVGMSCAVTGLPILAILMEKLEILHQPLGQRILRYAILDDIAIWGVLAIILMDWQRFGRQALFLFIFIVLTFGYRRLMSRIEDSDRWYVALIWLVNSGLFADWVGLHFIVGSFLAGVATDANWFGRARLHHFRETVSILLMPVFFLSTGLQTDWSMGGATVLVAAAFLLLASIIGKLAGIYLASLVLKWAPGEASIIGWLLQTKSLVMIVFAKVLLDKGIISHDSFTALVITAVGSTVLTVPIVTPKLKPYSNLNNDGHVNIPRQSRGL